MPFYNLLYKLFLASAIDEAASSVADVYSIFDEVGSQLCQMAFALPGFFISFVPPLISLNSKKRFLNEAADRNIKVAAIQTEWIL